VIVVGGFNSAIDRLADVDAIAVGGVTRLQHIRSEPGGKGLHVAMACATLGEPSTLVGLIDAGHRALFDETLSARGVRFVGVTIDLPIRTCWAIRDAAARVTELLEPGPRVSNDHAAMLAATFMRTAAEARYVVLSGSLPEGMPQDTYARLITALGSDRLLLDASGSTLGASLASAPLVVKPNRQEAAQIVGFPIESTEAAIRAAVRIASRGPRIVLLSLGAEGAVVYKDGRAWIVHAPPIEARNPVGAGDCLLAGFAVALHRGEPLEDCARYAVACGTAKASHPDTGICRRVDVEALLPLVTVSSLLAEA
jgi:1-phosphofructokinase family hexose kinase